MSNFQGRNLGYSVVSARTFGLSRIQGDLGERAVKVSLLASLTNTNDNSSKKLLKLEPVLRPELYMGKYIQLIHAKLARTY